MKNPVLAAVLNFVLFGAGTIYVGRRPLVGVLLLVGGSLAQAMEIAVSPVGTNAIPGQWPFLLAGLILLKIGLAADAWQEARSVAAA